MSNRNSNKSNTATNTATTTTRASDETRRTRKPVTIRVVSTGEQIKRVPIERSGYRVVRYENRYHIVHREGRTTPYILGNESGEGTLGRA